MIVPNHRPERKRATLRELSEITGLSTAGVSYALRGQVDRPARLALQHQQRPVAAALQPGRAGAPAQQLDQGLRPQVLVDVDRHQGW